MRLAVVDDDASIRFLMEHGLARLGHEVVAFADPEAALRAVRDAPARYDAVITDHGLQGLSGLELADALRRVRSDLRVILVSGYVTDALRASAAQAGVRDVLLKRLSVKELCELIHRLVSPAA